MDGADFVTWIASVKWNFSPNSMQPHNGTLEFFPGQVMEFLVSIMNLENRWGLKSFGSIIL